MMKDSFRRLEGNKVLTGIDVVLSVGLIGLFLSALSGSVHGRVELSCAYLLFCFGWRTWRVSKSWRAEIDEGVEWLLKERCRENGGLGAVSHLAAEGERIH